MHTCQIRQGGGRRSRQLHRLHRQKNTNICSIILPPVYLTHALFIFHMFFKTHSQIAVYRLNGREAESESPKSGF